MEDYKYYKISNSSLCCSYKFVI